ncbi:MAG TPA: ABC transporter ATP-binding protein [Acidimicrobiales bacterium]|jgi:NitT/TauT family transport system ATP-binding protein|nr:ABC transporter ATP-binding protein [Acidimicrobiales bacterium]
MALLTVQGVTMRYGGRESSSTQVVLEDISFDLSEREFLVVIGPSGCGKTTLLHLIAGFAHPVGGRIELQGRPVREPGSDRVVVFQQPWLYPWLSVRENVAFGLSLAGRRKVDWDKVDSMIAVVGLAGFERHAPYELSGGMQQRVALARALVMSPKILLMDEPFGALDAQTRHQLQEFLLKLWEELDVAVVFITHDIEEAILLGDRILVMGARPGRIALELDVKLSRPRDEATTLSPAFIELRRRALDTLREVSLGAAGIRVQAS